MVNYVKLGDIGEIFIGLTYKPENVSTEGMIVLRSSNIQDGELEFNDTVRVNCPVRENLLVKPNDILMCSRNGSAKLVGKCTMLPRMSEPMTFGAFMTIIRTPYNSYLRYFFDSSAFRNQIKGSATTTINQITRKMLDEIEVPVFDVESQIRITTQFEKLSKLIAMRKEQLAKLDELVKARFVEMFGDPQSNPHGYRRTRLSDIATYFNGLTYKPEDVEEEGTIVLRSSNIQNSQLDFADTVRVGCAIKNRLMVHENDILMCSRNGSARLVGKVALIKDIQEPMSFGAFMMIIRSQYFGYLMTYFQMDAFRQQIKTGATTTINQITGRMLDDVTVPLPPMVLVKQFTTFVEQTNKTKLTIQSSLDKLEVMKKALMQEYFG